VLSLAALAAAPPAPSPTAATTSRVLLAHVVSIDADAHSLAYRTTAGEEKTAAVAASALHRVRELKVGDGVMLTMREEAGEDTIVSVKKKTVRDSLVDHGGRK
jgi:hypothetical protein